MARSSFALSRFLEGESEWQTDSVFLCTYRKKVHEIKYLYTHTVQSHRRTLSLTHLHREITKVAQLHCAYNRVSGIQAQRNLQQKSCKKINKNHPQFICKYTAREKCTKSNIRTPPSRPPYHMQTYERSGFFFMLSLAATILSLSHTSSLGDK